MGKQEISRIVLTKVGEPRQRNKKRGGEQLFRRMNYEWRNRGGVFQRTKICMKNKGRNRNHY